MQVISSSLCTIPQLFKNASSAYQNRIECSESIFDCLITRFLYPAHHLFFSMVTFFAKTGYTELAFWQDTALGGTTSSSSSNPENPPTGNRRSGVQYCCCFSSSHWLKSSSPGKHHKKVCDTVFPEEKRLDCPILAVLFHESSSAESSSSLMNLGSHL